MAIPTLPTDRPSYVSFVGKDPEVEKEKEKEEEMVQCPLIRLLCHSFPSFTPVFFLLSIPSFITIPTWRKKDAL